MKKTLFAFLTFLQAGFMAHAGEYTTQSAYVGGVAGANLLSVDSDHSAGIHSFKTHSGFNVGVLAGVKFCSTENPYLNLRLEGEIVYRKNTMKSLKVHRSHTIHLHGKMTSATYMAKALYDIETNTKWTPYVGFGIGYMRTKGHFKITEGKFRGATNRFAYEYIGGIAYRIAEHTDIGAEYNYLLARKDGHEQTIAVTLKQYF